MYSKVYRRMWRRGGSFDSLGGPATPNAQHLWFYILTGDAGTSLPGVAVMTSEMLAAKLGWSRHLAKLEECAAEIAAAGMAEFDWDAGLIWCPAALDYNPPQSPNVVRAWGKAFDMLPECDLKDEIRQCIGQSVARRANDAEERKKGSGAGWGESFVEVFGEDLPEVIDVDSLRARGRVARASATATATGSSKTKTKTKRAPRARAGEYDKDVDFVRLWSVYPNHSSKKRAHGAWLAALKNGVIKADDVETIISHVEERASLDRQWLKNHGQYVPLLSTFINGERWNDVWHRDEMKAQMRVGSSENWTPPWDGEEARLYGPGAKKEHPRYDEYFDEMYERFGYEKKWRTTFREWLAEKGVKLDGS